MQKVILIGLGALGLTYAVKFMGRGKIEVKVAGGDKYNNKCDFFVLVDEERLKRYQTKKPVFNGVEQDFEYILPTQKFDADLIFITTKSQGLKDAIKNIKNFVSPKTRIISLINGISSEEQIAMAYPQAKVLKSYFIGHSAVRKENAVVQDGIGEIVMEHDELLEQFFNNIGINYLIPNDINYAMWLKYTFNIFSNQVSAILDMDFGSLKTNNQFKDFAKKIISEVRKIAEVKGINNLENLEQDAINSLSRMCDEGKTSMHQDILAKHPTEVDIFAGEIIQLGKLYNIKTPYNQVLYDLIKIKEEQNEHSIHSR